MIKLYKTTNNELHYWETWDNENNSASIHWGKVGYRGEVKTVKSGLFSNFRKDVQKEIKKKIVEFSNNNLLILTSTVHELEKLNKNIIDGLIKDAEKKLDDTSSTDKDRYVISYKINTLKEINQ